MTSSPTPSEMTSSDAGLLLLLVVVVVLRWGGPSLVLVLRLTLRLGLELAQTEAEAAGFWGPEEGEEGSEREEAVDREREEAEGVLCICSASWWAGDSSSSVSPMARQLLT